MSRAETAASYERFAREQVAGRSPRYVELARAVAGDPALLDLLERVAPEKRQPNLLLAVVKRLHGVARDGAQLREWVLADRERVLAELRTRRTQTNEPGRCALLMPLLASLPQPLALLEVGASAGLLLLPDRYAYDYEGHRVGGDSPVVLPCAPSGPVPLPERLPEVAWRAGIDLAPLDPRDPEAAAWLEALVWPEETDRLERLRGAMALAREAPPRVIRGDLVEALPALAAQAPRDATLVVFGVAVLFYLDPAARARFREVVGALGAEWLSAEAPGVVAPEVVARRHLVLARGGTPVGACDAHGRWLHWLTLR